MGVVEVVLTVVVVDVVVEVVEVLDCVRVASAIATEPSAID
jgi:hypothetical protein